MKHIDQIQDQIFWKANLGNIKRCQENLSVDVAIVGGGIAGLSAAQEFAQQGKKVALFERDLCGSGATGKSSGFITPNAELSLTDFAKRYDMVQACHIWQFIQTGVQDIAQNIKSHAFQCDFIEEDSIAVAVSNHTLKQLQIEHENLIQQGFNTVWYDQKELKQKMNAQGYLGGVGYQNAFGINPYAYCQELKKYLQSLGVFVFEDSPVIRVDNHTIHLQYAQVTAEFIVICVDRFLPDLGILPQDVYHAQTFVMASLPLSEFEIAQIFPEQRLMVWDTHLIYNYFRMTHDNRLLLGGGNLWTTYSVQENHNYMPIVNKLCTYFKTHFSQVDLQFEYRWPGLIGLSKDIAPIAGRDMKYRHIYYLAASAGLSIAAALGKYSAQHLLGGRDDLDQFFSPYRHFPVGGWMQNILGTRLTFAFCNFLKQNVP